MHLFIDDFFLHVQVQFFIHSFYRRIHLVLTTFMYSFYAYGVIFDESFIKFYKYKIHVFIIFQFFSIKQETLVTKMKGLLSSNLFGTTAK